MYNSNRITNVGRIGHLFEWKVGICLHFLALAPKLVTLKHLFGCCAENVRSSILTIWNLINMHLNSISIDVNDQLYMER